MTGNRIVAIDNGGDAGVNRDFVTGQPLRITGTVVALVMMSHHVQYIPVHQAAALDHVHTAVDVIAHFRKLLVAEFAGRPEQVGGDAQFAHVEQQTADGQGAQVGARQAELPPQGDRPDGGAHRVLVGVTVLLLHARQPDTGVGVAGDAVDHGVDGFPDLEDIQGPARGDLVENRAHGHRQLIHRGLGPGVLVGPAGTVLVFFQPAPREDLLHAFAGPGYRVFCRGRLVRALHGIDEHVLAVLLQAHDVFRAIDPEALHGEGYLQPGTVQPRDVHARLQISGVYLDDFQHSCERFPVRQCAQNTDMPLA